MRGASYTFFFHFRVFTSLSLHLFPTPSPLSHTTRHHSLSLSNHLSHHHSLSSRSRPCLRFTLAAHCDLKFHAVRQQWTRILSLPTRFAVCQAELVKLRHKWSLHSSGNRTQGALARLEALENDYPGAEMIEIYSNDDAYLDGEDQAIHLAISCCLSLHT
ncbi:uncharacterized protein LOC131323894 [Rhododendron vialii]|uniref:uncharacterized protein LOC131323894 n=1 Tax=Rhododendron vialii TaxID=182163 RepID=UPI00265E7772|nr:uncharacterized protein LOC131323894 [Rhododendron vialii]